MFVRQISINTKKRKNHRLTKTSNTLAYCSH